MEEREGYALRACVRTLRGEAPSHARNVGGMRALEAEKNEVNDSRTRYYTRRRFPILSSAVYLSHRPSERASERAI